MFGIFLKQLERQFRSCQNIATVVVDVLFRYHAVVRNPLFSVFHGEVSRAEKNYASGAEQN